MRKHFNNFESPGPSTNDDSPAACLVIKVGLTCVCLRAANNKHDFIQYLCQKLHVEWKLDSIFLNCHAGLSVPVFIITSLKLT